MLLEVSESAATLLVETSSVSQSFLQFSREQIISFLHHRATDVHSDQFRFNVGHFCKEYAFWADQAVECSLSAATRAADWIRSWPIGSFYTTPRGEPMSSRLGPHTLPPLITALNDPFIQAIYLLACSSPYEGSNDLLSHIRYASKGRPVHIIFLTGQKSIDYKAMEILHLISKETGGQFKVAYFNSDGKLLEVLRGTAKNFPTRDVDYLHSSATDFLGDLQFQSELHKSANDFSNSRNGQFLQLYNNQRSHVASIGDQLQLNKSQFGDLKIPIKHHHNSIDDSKIELQQKQLVNFLLNTSQHPSSEWNKSNSEMAEFLKLSHQLNAEGQLLHEMNDEKMEEIKQMFAKFYLEKTQQHPKSKHSRKFKALKGKTFEFPLEEHYHKHKKKSSRSKSARKSSRKRNSSTSSSTSSSSSSSSDSSDTERKSRLKALQNWTPPTAFVYPTSHAGSGDVWTRLHQGLPITNRPKTATRPTTARSTVSSAHSETKKVWRPPTRPSSGFITEGLRRPPTAAKQNERTMWQDKFWNSCVAKEASRTSIPPPPPGPPPPPLRRLQRPTVNNSNFLMGPNFNRRTPTGLGQPEVETIRELVKQNGVLVKALEKTAVPLAQQTYAPPKPTYPFRRPVVNSLRQEPTRERREWQEMAKMFDVKKSINDEIKNLAQVGLVTRHIPQGPGVPPPPSNRSLGHNYEAMKKSRDQLVAEQLQRREDIQRQRTQANYKQMYEKLVTDVQHNRSGAQNNGVVSERPIAYYPS